jgi:putative colanic acid biosynthesis acetyltransferase WcaF
MSLSRYRSFLLKIFGAKVGTNVVIKPGVKVYNPRNLIIKNYVWIGENVNFYSLDKITIDENVVISQEVYLCTGSHDYKSKSFNTIHQPIKINKNSWICIRSTLLMGVEIPQNTIINAGSMVNKKNIPLMSINQK